jgi:hypothetical protein
MKRAIFLLGFLGLVGLASAMSGISSYSVTTHGTSVAYISGLLPRIAVGVWGAFLLLLAFGIHVRSMAAYWGGWVLLASSCAWLLSAALPAILVSEPPPLTWFLVVSVAVVVLCTAFVFAYWGRWWRRQLGYFRGHHG